MASRSGELVMLIRIPARYRPGMSALELYEATRGVWRVGSRRNDVRIALSVVGGEVIEAYEVDGWVPAGSTPYTTRTNSDVRIAGRWEFVGRVAEGRSRSRFVGDDVREYLKRGNQNPITYVEWH